MNESFYTGKGIGVAILDTGIYPHIDFDSRICAFADFISHKKMPYDDNGQGSWQEAARLLWEDTGGWRLGAGLWH